MALEFCPDIVQLVKSRELTDWSWSVVTNEVIKNTAIQKTYYGIDRKYCNKSTYIVSLMSVNSDVGGIILWHYGSSLMWDTDCFWQKFIGILYQSKSIC